MPLFSEHITNMYYSGTPSYSSAPYSYSGSPYGTSYSASYLNPGGNYSTHSSIAPYTRTLSSRWLLGGGRTYSPILSTITEKGSSSPVRINSPRRTPISSRTYISSSYTPRPININTADIDVSRDKYRNKPTSTSSFYFELRRQNSKENKKTEPSPSKAPENSNVDVVTPQSSSPPHRSTIKRDRPVVRLHTVKRKERDSPRQLQTETQPIENNVDVTLTENNKSEPLKWRERLAEDLAFKNKKEKKTIGEKLVEKFTLKEKDDNEEEMTKTELEQDENPIKDDIPSTMEITLTDKTQLLGRRCSMELLAEQASLFDSLIRRENLSTATLDLSKIGKENVNNVETPEVCDKKKKKFEDQVNPLSTTKSDHSLLSKLGTKRKSLRKSTSGNNICKLDRISEISQLPTIEHISPKVDKKDMQNKADVKKVKPKLKPKITSNVEISSPSSPLKVVVENITVEEKPLPKKKGIFYSTAIEEANENLPPKEQINKALDTGHRKSVKIKIKAGKQKETDKIISPDPEDGDFWGKIGKRETIYLTHRKKDLEKANEEKIRSFGWFPEEDEITLQNSNPLANINNNNEQVYNTNLSEKVEQNNSNDIEMSSQMLPQNEVTEKQEVGKDNLNEMESNLNDKNCILDNATQDTTIKQDVIVDKPKLNPSENSICEEKFACTEDTAKTEVKEEISLNNKSSMDILIKAAEKLNTQSLNDNEIKVINTAKDNKTRNVIKKVQNTKENRSEKSLEKNTSGKNNKDTACKLLENTEILLEEKSQRNNTLEKCLPISKPAPELATASNQSSSIPDVTSTPDGPKDLKNELIDNKKQLDVEITKKHSEKRESVNKLDSDEKNADNLASKILPTHSDDNKVMHEQEKKINSTEIKDSNLKETEAERIDIRRSTHRKSQPNEIIVTKDIPHPSLEKSEDKELKKDEKTEIVSPIKRDSVKKPLPLMATNLLFGNKKHVKDVLAHKPLIATPRPLQKKAPRVIRSSSSSESSTASDESSEEDEDESSESSTECYESENNIDGRTSTGSNDSGFDSSAPTSPSGFSYASKGGDHPSASTSGATNNALDIVQQELEQSTAYGLFRKTGRFTPPARSIPRFRKYTIDDFQFIKVLGKGSFGKVMLAELRETEYYYAVKCLKKDVVLEDDDVECTLIERKVLALGTNHPYLCHLFATFQTDSHLFFVMEYLNGGDLMFHIQQSGRFAEPRARFYAAEIVSGLKFLHKRGIVYRDLKLDNILLDFDGHVRIADFGMCKLQIYLDKTADTFCGTPDYMAPEIIKGLKYNQTVDWWSFGVLLYEMLIGQSPFSGCDEDELFWSICNEMPSYPRFLSSESLSILTRLLDKDARSRLGGAECMHGDIRDQDFFKPIQWDKLERRELEAPFKPRVRHPLDTQYFDRAFTGERPRLTAVEPQVLRSMDQEPFRGFSYTNPNATDR